MISKTLPTLLVLFLCFTSRLEAAPTTLTYQGRIVKSDGAALEFSSVSFIFKITDPSGACIIYQEQVNGYDMTNSNGVFDVSIGNGTVTYPNDGSLTILDAFNNSRSFVCSGGSNYIAKTDDTRNLRVQFYDGIGWQTISPDSVIRTVPFAGYSLSAQKLGPYAANDFLLKAGLPTCSSGSYLTWDGSALICATPSAPPSSSLSGDVSGTLSANSVDKIKGTVLSISSLNSGDVLKYNGSNWVNGSLSSASLADSSSLLKASQMPANCSSNQTLTFSSPTGTWNCTAIAMSADNFGSQSANTFLAAPNGSAGNAAFRSIAVADLPAGIATQWTTSSSQIYYTGGNVGIGTSNPGTKLEVAGVIHSTSGGFKFPDGTMQTTAGGSQWVTSGSNIYYNAGNIGAGIAVPRAKLNVVGDPGIMIGDWGGGTFMNQHQGISQAPSSFSDSLAEKPYTLIGGNSYLDRSEALIGGSTNLGNQSSVQNIVFYTHPTKNTALGNERMRIDRDGKVGIGTSSPGYTLHVVGTAGLSSGTAWTNASDLRLKDIQGDYEYGLQEVLKLHTVKYNYKKGNPLGLPSDFSKTGFIAQEVQKVIPEAVSVRKDGYLEINVDPIHWAVVNAIQDLHKEVLRLNSENQQLRNRLDVQEKELALIKTKLGL